MCKARIFIGDRKHRYKGRVPDNNDYESFIIEFLTYKKGEWVDDIDIWEATMQRVQRMSHTTMMPSFTHIVDILNALAKSKQILKDMLSESHVFRIAKHA